MRRRLEAVIFDLDGTIVDSEPLWFESDTQFTKNLGILFNQEEWNGFIGMGGRAFAALVKERLNLGETLDELAEKKDDAYLDTAKGRIKAFPEIVKLIKALRLQGMNLAVASGSSRRVIEATLDSISLRPVFSVILSADDVPRGKPFPDIFLEAAARLGVEPGNCLVMEDSERGIQAALDAGMACVAVPTHPVKDLKLLEKSNLAFLGENKFNAEKVFEWMDQTYCICEECEFYSEGRCEEKD